MIPTISLFSGCGGLDLGFIIAGFKIVWAVDKNKNACDTHYFNLGKQIHCLDIRKINPDSIPNAKVIICGPPCQGFSNIGKRNPYTIIHENLVFLTKIIVQGRLNFDISSQ